MPPDDDLPPEPTADSDSAAGNAPVNKFRWLKDAARDAHELEASLTNATSWESLGLDPYEFQLANGNDVKVVFAIFWERPTPSDEPDDRPLKDYFIRVYSNEDCLSRRLAFQWEFRARAEFSLPAITKIWDWLGALIASREVFKFDSLEDFIEEFEIAISDFSATDEDAVEHLEHLPELTNPEAFDKVDDSIFNDQNDNTPER